MKRPRNTARPASARVLAAARSHLDIETLEPRSMLAADTIDALVTPATDETPACFWTPADAEVAVLPVDTPVTDPVAVPSIATDPVPMMYSVLDTSTVLPIFVVDPTDGSDGTGLLTDGMTQGTGDSSVDSGVSDGSVDGSAAGATDSGDGLATDPPIGAPVTVVDPIDTGVFPIPVYSTVVDSTAGTNSLTGDATDGSADGSAAGVIDSSNGLTTDPTVDTTTIAPGPITLPIKAGRPHFHHVLIGPVLFGTISVAGDTTQETNAPPSDTSSIDGTEAGVIDTGSVEELVFDHVIAVDPPVWEMRDLAGVTMFENLVGFSVAQPAVESPAVDFIASPVVAFAGSDQPAAAISPESRAAAFSMVPVSAQPSDASMYAAFAAGFSQSGSDGQGSSAFAGAKRSVRR